MYNYTECLLTGDALTFYRRKTLKLHNGCTTNAFDNVLSELTAHVFLVHAYREQKRYMRRFLWKPKEMTTHEYFTKVQEINNHLTIFRTETEEVATVMSNHELVETLYHLDNIVLYFITRHCQAPMYETCATATHRMDKLY